MRRLSTLPGYRRLGAFNPYRGPWIGREIRLTSAIVLGIAEHETQFKPPPHNMKTDLFTFLDGFSLAQREELIRNLDPIVAIEVEDLAIQAGYRDGLREFCTTTGSWNLTLEEVIGALFNKIQS